MLKITIPRLLRTTHPHLGGWRSKIPGYKHFLEDDAAPNANDGINRDPYGYAKYELGQHGAKGTPRLAADMPWTNKEFDPWHWVWGVYIFICAKARSLVYV